MKARHLKSLLASAGAAACLLVLSHQADAAPITYTFDSTCTANCSMGGLGLSVGSPVGGSITFKDGTTFAPGASITSSDVATFDFSFDIFSVTNATAAAWAFDGLLGGDGTTFSQYVFIAGNTLSPSTGDLILLDLEPIATDSTYAFTTAGECPDSACAGASFGFSALMAEAPLVPQSVTPPPPTHVSEPGTLALFGFGLAALGFTRRRWKTV